MSKPTHMYREGPGNMWQGCNREEAQHLSAADFQVVPFNQGDFDKAMRKHNEA